MIEQSVTDGLAMATTRSDRPNEGSCARGQRQQKSSKDQQKSNKEQLWCTYCKKQHLTKETYFKLHSKEHTLKPS